MHKLGTATFRWGNPGEYLHHKAGNMSRDELLTLVETVFHERGFDYVQEHFESDMVADGYFNSIETCAYCGNPFEEEQTVYEAEDGTAPLHLDCGIAYEQEENL